MFAVETVYGCGSVFLSEDDTVLYESAEHLLARLVGNARHTCDLAT
jgi:hypothetical protein